MKASLEVEKVPHGSTKSVMGMTWNKPSVLEGQLFHTHPKSLRKEEKTPMPVRLAESNDNKTIL